MLYRFTSSSLVVLVSVGALLTMGASTALAQDSDNSAQMPHTAALTVNARLVVLDVVVTDASGKPVDGLTRKDFEVYEDNQQQRIRSFESPSAHTLTQYSFCRQLLCAPFAARLSCPAARAFGSAHYAAYCL